MPSSAGISRVRPISILGIAVFVFLLLHLWTLRPLWNPVIVGAVLIFLLWPLREQRGVRRILWALTALTGLWILSEARSVVYPVVGGLLLATFLDPFVDRMEAHRIPRPLAALVILLPLLSLITIFALFVVPPVVNQLGRLLSQIPELLNRFYESVLAPFLAEYLPGFQETPMDLLQPVLDSIEGVFGALGKGLAGLQAVLQALFVVILTPVLGYYFLVDLDRLMAWCRRKLPERFRDDLTRGAGMFARILGRYLRGQLLVSSIMAAAASVAFTLLGLPYSLVVGLATGALNVVPVVGYWVSFGLAAVACFFAPSPLILLLKVAIVFVVLQAIEGNLLSPRILGRQLGLNPGLLLVVMLVLAVFMGVLGFILAAPVLAFAQEMLRSRRGKVSGTDSAEQEA